MVKFRNGQHGFSLVELMIVIALGLIVMGMAIGGVPAMLKTSRADGGLAELASAVRSAREQSISNRRNVRITFGTNTVSVTRVEYCPATCTPSPGGNWASYSGCSTTCTQNTTVTRTVTLEGRTEFRLVTGLPDTPDAFGNSAAVALGTLVPAMFTTDGSFINSNGDVLNGTLFIAVPGDSLSARAVTIFGATGAMHLWRWNGRVWVEA
jgi:prepilin-type N-terminal cleavage/methylation domain-containing protein